MSKILDLVLQHKQDLTSDWTEDLDKIGVLDEINFVYKQGWTIEEANRVLAFVILAYDNESGWIELHKNRLDNKRKIWNKLGGVEDKFGNAIIESASLAAKDLRVWLMRHTRDWRWDTIMTCFDYHAEMMEFGGFKTMDQLETIKYTESEGGMQEVKEYHSVSVDKLSKGNLDKGSNIEKGIAMRQKGETLLEEIKKEFQQVDSVLEKEGKRKITAATDIMSWEKFIASLQK